MNLSNTACFRLTAASFVAAVLFFTGFPPAFPQVKDPDLPDSPDVVFSNKSDAKSCEAEVNYAGGSISGDVYFSSEYFRDINGNGSIYSWESIKSIRMLSWVRRPKGKSWVFYPESYEVTLKNGTAFRVDGNIRELNRFRLVKNRRQRTLYSYYYDDYVKGRWINSGAVDFYQPSLKPAEGCVVLIVFR